MPGIYTMEVFAEGFVPREINFAVVEKNPTVLNITLTHVSFFIQIHFTYCPTLLENLTGDPIA